MDGEGVSRSVGLGGWLIIRMRSMIEGYRSEGEGAGAFLRCCCSYYVFGGVNSASTRSTPGSVRYVRSHMSVRGRTDGHGGIANWNTMRRGGAI